MIRDIKIGMRSALFFGLLGLITLALGVFAIVQLAKINDSTDVLTLHRIPALSTATELRRHTLRSQILVTELSDAQSQQERNSIRQELSTVESEYTEAEKRMEPLARSAEAQQLLNNVRRLHDAFTSTLPELYRLSDAQNTAEALTYRRNTVLPAAEQLIAELDKLGVFQLRRADEINNQATKTYTNSRTALITGIVVTLALLSLLAFVYSRSLLLPIHYAVKVARRIAGGDLTEQISDNHKDEAADMLRALADMQTQLRQTLRLIGDSSQQLATTSEELSVVTNQSTQIVTEQSDQLEQAATAVTELTTAIEEVARNANSTSDTAEVADEKTQLGPANKNNTGKHPTFV